MSALKRRLSQMKLIRKLAEAKGTISNDYSKCIYCGHCQRICSVEAITVSKHPKSWSIDHNLCVRCTHCIAICPRKALTLEKNR